MQDMLLFLIFFNIFLHFVVFILHSRENYKNIYIVHGLFSLGVLAINLLVYTASDFYITKEYFFKTTFVPYYIVVILIFGLQYVLDSDVFSQFSKRFNCLIVCLCNIVLQIILYYWIYSL